MEKKVIVSEKSPAAIGPYSQAIEYNGIVYTSGVIGVNPATGEVGETIEEQTTQVFENLKGLLADAGSSLDQAIKTTVFIKNMDDFAKVNEIYATYFTGAFPARSCVEVARLRVADQAVIQSGDGLQIQVVGGFVQHQKLSII